MGLRIRGGRFRGREIDTLKSDKTRPTSDKIREAVFNMWQFSIEDSRFLDLFAGSGAMGIEALSRGAQSVTFTEKSKEAFACLKKNLDKCGCLEQAHLFFGDAYRLLEKLPFPYDLVYIDPPYATPVGDYLKLLAFFDDPAKISEGGRLIIEENINLSKALSTEIFKHLCYDGERVYGSTRLQLLRAGISDTPDSLE